MGMPTGWDICPHCLAGLGKLEAIEAHPGIVIHCQPCAPTELFQSALDRDCALHRTLHTYCAKRPLRGHLL